MMPYTVEKPEQELLTEKLNESSQKSRSVDGDDKACILEGSNSHLEIIHGSPGKSGTWSLHYNHGLVGTKEMFPCNKK